MNHLLAVEFSVGISVGLAVLFSVHSNTLQLYHILAKHTSWFGLLFFGEQGEMMGREELNLDVFRLCIFAPIKSVRTNQCEKHCFNF